jgi:O-antigen/teichoic acid export membrane protein
MSLTQKALHAFKWSVLGEVASRAIGPLVFLVMARLLVPVDFGVVAAATVIISFSQVFSDAGLAKALIQRQERTEESANVVFWLNLGIGLLVVAILQFAAPQIAGFFHDQRITPVVRVLSLQILLAAFSSVHTALLQKGLNFKQLFWVRLVTTGVPGLASIPLAMYGMGYWALVAGTLSGQVVQSIMLWNRSPWRPHWGLDRVLAGELIAFGKWAMLSGLLGWFYGWMDAIIVGHYLGSHDMGLYRTGNTFVTMIFGVIFSPLLPVLYSLFSRAQDDHPKLRAALVKVTHAIALIAIPLGFFLFVVSGQLADALFGLNWLGVGPVIGFMALMHAFSWIVGANGEIYRAIGKPNVETWANAALLAVYSAGYVVAVQYGLLIFLETRLGLAILAMIAHIVIARYIIGLPISNWFYWGVFGVSGAAATAVHLLGTTVTSPLVDLVDLFVSGALFALITLTGLLVFERQFIRQLVEIVKKRG